ncbi:hypothetical protein AB0I10_11385 [Streptomyces sp. NPDC050636]|uniref:hypothetical protein n=1 Tax=Streptomyces sp. NPDC050636 TaxID=3154510 RepID=UPI00344AEE78
MALESAANARRSAPLQAAHSRAISRRCSTPIVRPYYVAYEQQPQPVEVVW